jgi:hypothetical protein
VARKALRAKVVGVEAIRQRLDNKFMQPLTKTMHKRISRLWRDAGSAFIRAAMTRVLVETGMSAASFFPLSRAIKRPEAAAAIKARLAEKKVASLAGIKRFPSGKRGPGRRSEIAGKAVGADAFIFEFGTPSDPVLQFQFVTLVFQLAFHEPSEKAVKAGFEAFKVVLNSQIRPIFAVTLRQFLIQTPGARRVLGAKPASITGRLR